MKKQLLKILSLTLFTIFFSGCVSLTKELPSFNTYTLTNNTIAHKGQKIDKTIRVLEPKAIYSKNSRNISYTKDGIEQENYALNRWSDKPTRMLQNIIASSLANSELYTYVTTYNRKIDADFSLYSELDQLSHVFKNDDSYAQFSIRVFLKDNKTKNVYYKNFIYETKLQQDNIKSFVKTINKTINNFNIDLNDFIQTSLNK